MDARSRTGACAGLDAASYNNNYILGFIMKTPFIFRVLGLLCMMLVVGFAHAESFNFQVDKGEVSTTPSRCITKECSSQTSSIKGTFTAEIDGSAIHFSNSKLYSESGEFSLPESPNSESNGSVFTVKFSLSENTLILKGSIDSRAFDGPLQEYAIVASVIPDEESDFDPFGYYQIRQDFRKCVSPMCGGIYAAKINGKKMRCPNGTKAKECYIGTTNWDAINGSPFSAAPNPIVKGVISKDTVLGSEWGIFTAEAAYRPASKNASRQKVFGLKNNGIVCITAPCFSYDEYLINHRHMRKVSSYDLTRVKASKEDLEQASSILANGGVLIVAGQNNRTRYSNFRGEVNRGVNLVASQFYLPITNKPVEATCEAGYNLTDFGCSTKYGCFYPQLELTTNGGAALVDPKTGEIVSNTTFSCVDSCEPPAESIGYGRCLLNLP